MTGATAGLSGPGWTGPLLPAPLLVVLVAVAAATAVLAGLGAGPVLAAMPVLAAVLAWALATARLRSSTAALLLAVLVADDSRNAQGRWHTPWAIVGDLLRANLDAVVPAAHGFKLNGTEVLAVALLAVAVVRRARGDRRDLAGFVLPAPIAVESAGLAVLGVLAATAIGLFTGGTTEIAIWQARPHLETVALFALFAVALRGPRDHAWLGRLIVVAAVVRAGLAAYVRYVVVAAPGERPNFATDHGDSILFATAATILLVHVCERPDLRRLRAVALFLPVILLGMHANDRRVAWVGLVLALVAGFLVAPWGRWQRLLVRGLLVTLPVAALYVAAGWSSDATVFRPVGTIRSLLDNRSDRSTWDRHVENWNLAMSMKDRPFLGRGFGHEWDEIFVGDQIVSIFPQYRSEPHNQLLGLLLFAGVGGFTAIWSMFLVTVYLGARGYRRARVPEDRVAALSCVGVIVIVAAQFYGDLGPYWIQTRVLAALAMAVAAKLAMATGAWPSGRAARSFGA